MKPRLLVGAVIYDPKVVAIWEIIKEFFASRGYPMDCVFYNDYGLMTDALVAGHIQVAWNSPLAWLDVVRRTNGRSRPIAMRDTDRDRRTHIIVRKDGPVRSLSDLKGRTLATGAKDSPQATLLPIHLMRQKGLVPGRDFRVLRHDLMLGKHGDHVGGELEALHSLQGGRSDACAALDMNWERWQGEGVADPGELKSIAVTDPFDHCNFSVLESFSPDEEKRWTDVLFSMSYENPDHHKMMEMEGLKAWLPGRTSGYGPLTAAVREQNYFGEPSVEGR
jgi:ABC-type phosphate/phosphonate transport system substrate-binding protein